MNIAGKKYVIGISKNQLPILKVVDNTETRPQFRGVKITRDGYIEATDTKVFLRMPLELSEQDNLPTNLKVKELDQDIWVSREGLEKAAKNLPKSAPLPMLRNIYIDVDNGDVRMASTDLEHTVNIDERMVKQNIDNFPDAKTVIELGKPTRKVILSVSQLKKLTEIIEKSGVKDDHKRLTFFLPESEKSPIHFLYPIGDRLDMRQGIGAIMPLKQDNPDRFNDGKDPDEVIYNSIAGTKPEPESEQSNNETKVVTSTKED